MEEQQPFGTVTSIVLCSAARNGPEVHTGNTFTSQLNECFYSELIRRLLVFKVSLKPLFLMKSVKARLKLQCIVRLSNFKNYVKRNM